MIDAIELLNHKPPIRMICQRHFALLLLAGIALASLLAFPWFILHTPAIAAAIAVFFSQLCHQNPDRSFTLAGTQLPVCARCLALYVGGFLGVAIYPTLKLLSQRGREMKALFLVSLALLALDVGLDMAGLWRNTFVTRCLTGALCGGTAGLLLSWAFRNLHLDSSHAADRRADHHSIL